jgi:hypothetical protein
MSLPENQEINGNPTALSFDRAVDELRRGRAVQVTDGARGLVVAAIETVQGSLFARLVASWIDDFIERIDASPQGVAGFLDFIAGNFQQVPSFRRGIVKIVEDRFDANVCI